MCGFVGFIDPKGLRADAPAVVAAMSDGLIHRGPDDRGSWLDPDAGIALGFRRLAIVDLSDAGHQPMVSASGRYVIAFNGEVYNHLELRSHHAGRDVRWRGRSDTESLLAAIDHMGIGPTLTATVGMFAFALWDREERCLTLARDRMGEKPLYYGWQGGTFYFASELNGLRPSPGYAPGIDRNAVASYLRYGFVPAPYAIDEGMHKLLPGSYLTIDPLNRGRVPDPIRYWSVRDAFERGAAAPFGGDDAEATDALVGLLQRSISLQRVADVPLGAFLSGGIDSSVVVALMQQEGGTPVRTFTIGFTEPAYDESGFARAVAAHLGTDHHELVVAPHEVHELIQHLGRHYDEPFGDPSALPTLLLASLARRHVTVALSGDAGDELFGGYDRYRHAQRSWDRVKWLPSPLRRPTGSAARAMAAAARRLETQLPRSARLHRLAQQGRSLHAALTDDTINDLYAEQASLWKFPCDHVRPPCAEPPSVHIDRDWQLRSGTALDQMTYSDMTTYLTDDILVKVDRAAMAFSLETRIPMLDHRIVEFAWSLPTHLKQRPTGDKHVLRSVLARYVPRALTDRPKKGFGVPLGSWLRGPLRAWADDLLSERRLHEAGLLRPQGVRQVWASHLGGTMDRHHELWPVLMLQLWMDRRR
jgi:asparagine synthase (glutamine-hydrolysing)